jgi:low temperature requirement protein LtrA
MPHAYGDDALTLAIAYGAVRAAHIALFILASQDEPLLRHSVAALAGSTALGVALVIVGALFDWPAQGVIWLVALVLDIGGPYFFGADGWQLVPGHFAERHGLIILVALGESIVALGVGADGGLGGTEITAAVLGVALAAGMWWVYFDVSSITSARLLESLPPGRVQNECARDCYSILHLPMVAGIVLIAFGLHDTLAHTNDALPPVPGFGLAGGVAIYFLGHVAFRYRGFHHIKWSRLATAAIALALIPLERELDAIVSLAIVTALVWALIVFESIRYAELRDDIRHNHSQGEHHS